MGREVAVFLDWENIKISLEEVGRSPDAGLLRRAVEQFGRMSVAKAYSDWSAESYRRDMEALYTSGIEPVYAPSKMPSGDEGQMRWHHNSVDIKLAVDCTLTAATRPEIGTFVLVTGDADFIHLVNCLRWQGRRVVVIGTSWNAARRLIENADVFIAYDGGVDRGLTSALMAVNRAQQRPPLRSVPPPPPIVQPMPPPAPPRSHAPADPDEAFTALSNLVRGWPEGIRLSRLKGMLRERLGRFDERRIGFSRFERFAREAERRGVVRIEPGPDEPMAYPPGARIPVEVVQRSSDNGSAAVPPEPMKPEPAPAESVAERVEEAVPLVQAATNAIVEIDEGPAEAPIVEAPIEAAADTESAEATPARRTAARAPARRGGRRRGTRAAGEEAGATEGTEGAAPVVAPTAPTGSD